MCAYRLGEMEWGWRLIRMGVIRLGQQKLGTPVSTRVLSIRRLKNLWLNRNLSWHLVSIYGVLNV